MCLFSSDMYSGCQHVECNLVRAIQIQNSHIFPQVMVNQAEGNNIYSQNIEVSRGIQSQSIAGSRRVGRSQDMQPQQQQHPPIQTKIKSQVAQHQVINITHRPIQNHQQHQKNSYPQPQTIQPNITQSTPVTQHTPETNQRLQALQQQVYVLKNGMRFLINSLREKSIMNEQEYQCHEAFLQQVEMLDHNGQKGNIGEEKGRR